MCVSGSYDPPGQFVPPFAIPCGERSQRSFDFADDRRCEDRPHLVSRDDFQRFSPQLGSEIDQIVDGRAVPIVCRRLGREWLCRARLFAGDGRLLHRPLFYRPDRLSCDTVEHIQERLFRRLRNGLYGLPIDRDVGKNGRARNIHIPDAMMHELIVPFSLAGMKIDGNQALAEETVAGTVAAVVIAGRKFDGKINHVRVLRRR